jgi:hypothetical protein
MISWRSPHDREKTMDHRRSTIAALFVAASAGSAAVAGSSRATAPPVGPLPAGPTAAIKTETGELVAFALPHRTKGRVWRIARSVNAHVLRQVSEADVGSQVVLVFKAAGPGTATVAFGLTRGERPQALESRRFTVTVRP